MKKAAIICTLSLVLLIVVCGLISDSKRYTYTLKVYYSESEYSIEKFVHIRERYDNFMFKEGCITDFYNKTVCGVRKYEVLSIEENQ